MKKMIVSDLDGTLLRSDKTISAHSIEVLRSIEEKGIQLVFATARPPRDAFRLNPDELKNNLVICYNGAVIYNNKELIYSREMPLSTTREIFKEAGRFGLNQISTEVNDVLHSNFDVAKVFGSIPYTSVDLDEYAFEKTHKVMIYAEEKIPAGFIQDLPETCTVVVTDQGTLCQIMPRDVSKWNSIAHVLEDLEMDQQSVIAFGDDFNDMEMIQHAGMGVAMGNAVDELKTLADHVTVTNDQDGFAVFLRDLCL